MINVIWLFLIVSGISYGLVSGNGALINEEIVASVNSGIELLGCGRTYLEICTGIGSGK